MIGSAGGSCLRAQASSSSTTAAGCSITPAPSAKLIAGFWIWKCASLQDAIAWVKRCPNPMPGESEIEIRQVFDTEDFGEALTPELREQEERLRAQVAAQSRPAG